MPENRFQPPKGMRDIYPEEMVARQAIFSKIREIMKLYSFREVEPTKIEHFETLAAKSGKEIEKEIYTFEDKAGRKLGLRFDLTVGMARMVASSAYPLPARWFCIADMFRYEAPQKGRHRAFWQWDAEIFGSSNIFADAECIAIGCDVMSAFDIEFEVRISSRKLVEGIMRAAGIPENRILDAFRCVDKLQKIGRENVLIEMEKRGIDPEKGEKVLDALKISGTYKDVEESVKSLNSSDDLMISKALKELCVLDKALKSFGVDRYCTFDLSIVRGLDYYTGIVFEGYATNRKVLGSSLFGGGRYDGLVGLYGKDVPAVGLAGGVERLMEVLKAEGKLPQTTTAPDYFVAFVTPELMDVCASVASKLRKRGMAVEMELMDRSLSKQLKHASRIGAKKVIIVGPKELEEGKVKVRDMESGEEVLVEVNNL